MKNLKIDNLYMYTDDSGSGDTGSDSYQSIEIGFKNGLFYIYQYISNGGYDTTTEWLFQNTTIEDFEKIKNLINSQEYIDLDDVLVNPYNYKDFNKNFDPKKLNKIVSNMEIIHIRK